MTHSRIRHGCGDMKKHVLAVIAVSFILVVPMVGASSVTRSFSSNPVYTDYVLTVSLTVVVDGGETIYAIRENVPAGWSVYDERTGNSTEQGTLKWIYYNETNQAQNDVYQYKLISPNTSGPHTFSGTYIFEGMGSETAIGGSVSISVEEGAGDVNNDGRVDFPDLIQVGRDFGLTSDDITFWNSTTDTNYDNIIDIYDLTTVGKNYGNVYS